MIVKDHRKLADILRLRNITHREIAGVAGWKAHSYVGRICRGQIRSIDPDAAIKIAIYLDLPIDDLFTPKAFNISVHAVKPNQTAA